MKTTKREFDEIVLKNLVSKIGEDKFGYTTPDNKEYDIYYKNDVFKSFVEEMKTYKSQQYFNQYNGGSGGELKETNSRFGILPPKMASVASSSRFCYLALRDGGKAIGAGDDVMFEAGCEIKGVKGNSPQLDAWFPDKNIYVEAKCHEIFDRHKTILKEAYRSWICGEKNGFGFSNVNKINDKEFEIPLSEFGLKKTSSMFDIKQFLCHLMGIASQKGVEKQATLVYLFFKPRTDDFVENEKIDKIFDELKKEIELIWDCKTISDFAKKNNIKLMAVAEYAETMQKLNNDNTVILFK